MFGIYVGKKSKFLLYHYMWTRSTNATRYNSHFSILTLVIRSLHTYNIQSTFMLTLPTHCSAYFWKLNKVYTYKLFDWHIISEKTNWRVSWQQTTIVYHFYIFIVVQIVLELIFIWQRMISIIYLGSSLILSLCSSRTYMWRG